VPLDDLNTLDDLASALASDARFVDFPLARRGQGWLAVLAGQGTLVLGDLALLRQSASSLVMELVEQAAKEGFGLLLLGREPDFEGLDALRAVGTFGLVAMPVSRSRMRIHLINGADRQNLRTLADERQRTGERYRFELGEMMETSRALASERDDRRLLSLILERARFLTNADAGSIYIAEGGRGAAQARTLRFAVAQNDSVSFDFKEVNLPVDASSIVGRAVLDGEVINIPDLYLLDQPGRNPWRFRHDRSFDRMTGYQARSMLTVALRSKGDEIIGCVQLINRRRIGAPTPLKGGDFDAWVEPFDDRAIELATALASQAGVTLENTLLYGEIQRLFEGFVAASVTAIESRDPTTSGHSQRVARLTVALAEEVHRIETGPFARLRFDDNELKELEYAALLHDFGKVGVREHVLVKARKLYDHERDLVLARLDFVRVQIEADALRRKLAAVEAHGARVARPILEGIDAEVAAQLAELEEFRATMLAANEPTVLDDDKASSLDRMASATWIDPAGATRPLLAPGELGALAVRRGSLTPSERQEIERHVVHTIQFLSGIPWGRKYARIPEIAGAHHEKLDGSGYPRGLPGAEIPVESRMMTIADIFDALTASDRPYKSAVPVARALAILADEVKRGCCDAALFDVFASREIWRRTMPSPP